MKNERLEGLTDKIFERDSYLKDFGATLISCEEADGKYKAILDTTAFFPEGGGQTSDTGLIGDAKVLDVQNEDGNIIHYLDKMLEPGKEYACSIDWQRRFRKMQNHSAEHLFCGIIHNAYGYDNVGFHMNDEEVTLDVNGEMTKEELAEIERRANEAIYENRRITISFPNKDEIKNLEYRSKLDLDEGVRLVTIDGYDICACCAPHLLTTAEIGVIKVVDFFLHRGGTRITLRAGISAYEDYAKLDEANKGLVALLSSKRYETYEFAKKADERYHELIEENKSLKWQFAAIESDRILEEMKARAAEDKEAKLIFSEALDRVQMRNIINSITENYSIIVAGFMVSDKGGYDYIVGRGKGLDNNLSLFAKELNGAFDGSGGGKPEMIQGHVNGSKEEIEKFFKNL